MILQMKEIKIGLDLTKEIKKIEFIVQGEINPDMDKIKEASKNVYVHSKSLSEVECQLFTVTNG